MLRFETSHYFALLWLIPALILFYAAARRARKRALERFGRLHLLQKLGADAGRRSITKFSLLLGAVLLLIVAAARPQIGTKIEEVKREGVDIIVAVDVSNSMLARDVRPNRLEKAKREVAAFIDRLRGDRIGLIAFAGTAYVACPLTLDYASARFLLDVFSPDMIPVPGTALGSAVQRAVETFDQQERKYKVLVLITDGEDHTGDWKKAVAEAVRQGIVIYCIGIGSPAGEPIPLAEGGGTSAFKKNRQGEVVLTRLDEETLVTIARETGGKYYRAGTSGEELDKIYAEIARMEKKELGSLQFSQFEDRFQYVVALALLFLLIEFMLPERIRTAGEWRGRFM